MPGRRKGRRMFPTRSRLDVHCLGPEFRNPPRAGEGFVLILGEWIRCNVGGDAPRISAFRSESTRQFRLARHPSQGNLRELASRCHRSKPRSSSAWLHSGSGILCFSKTSNCQSRRELYFLSLGSPPMFIFLTTPRGTLFSTFRSSAALELENLALRHQIGVLRRSARKRPKLTLAGCGAILDS
jgi:hypothetical protein